MKKKPPKGSPFAKLADVKRAMESEEAARVEAERARKEAALARGELESRKPRPSSPSPAPTKKPAVDVWRPDLDKELFAAAMSGVEPLSPRRANPAPREGIEAPPVRALTVESKLRRAHAEGGAELELLRNDPDCVQGARRGHAFALEALGRFASPDDTVDLHRLSGAEAAMRAAEFVRSRRARGLRCVRVIHGRGAGSPDGGVLRDAVVDALRRPPASVEVDAFATAPDALGGAGALLVALRHR